MPKITKIAISLPDDMLKDVEQERRENGESQSEFFSRAVEALLRRSHVQDMTERYIRDYRQNPETKEESEVARYAASAILSEESW